MDILPEKKADHFEIIWSEFLQISYHYVLHM